MKKLDEKTIYKGRRVTLKVTNYEEENKIIPIEHVSVKDSVVIVPVKFNGNIVLIEEERPVIDKMTIACPAGLIEDGEEPIEAAMRELEEETGYKAKKLTFLRKTYTSCGYTSERQYFFMAEGLYITKQNLDDAEVNIKVKEYKEADVLKMIADGTIDTSSAVITLLDYFLRKG